MHAVPCGPCPQGSVGAVAAHLGPPRHASWMSPRHAWAQTASFGGPTLTVHGAVAVTHTPQFDCCMHACRGAGLALKHSLRVAAPPRVSGGARVLGTFHLAGFTCCTHYAARTAFGARPRFLHNHVLIGAHAWPQGDVPGSAHACMHARSSMAVHTCARAGRSPHNAD